MNAPDFDAPSTWHSPPQLIQSYIESNGRKFFDLEKDPLELHNIANNSNPMFRRMERLLIEHQYKESLIGETSEGDKKSEIDDHAIEKLKSLGY